MTTTKDSLSSAVVTTSRDKLRAQFVQLVMEKMKIDEELEALRQELSRLEAIARPEQ